MKPTNSELESRPSSGTNKRRRVSVFFIIFTIVFVLSAAGLIYTLVIVPRMNDQINSDIKEIYYSDGTSEENSESSRVLRLSKINADIKGWIHVPNTKIDYPVLQSAQDPEYYLYRDYNKNYSKYGSIFIDSSCDLSDKQGNIILHGHHMRDGKMFANLKKFTSLDFYKSSPVVTFDTLEGTGKWKIISVFKTNTLRKHGPVFNYLRSDFSNKSDFLNYIYQVRMRSLINCPVDINDSDTLLTLSTCSYEFKEFRTVVVARKVREGEDESVDVYKATKTVNPLMPECWYERYGGSPPTMTDFEDALKSGKINWYNQ